MNTLFDLGKIQMLSLWQPWAWLCVRRNPFDDKAEKQIETRHWLTNFRGLLAIHATKTLTPEAKFEIEENEEIQAALERHGFHPSIHGAKHLTFGAIVGVAELYKIVQMDAKNEWLKTYYPEREKSFGLYEKGRYAWCLRNQIEFKQPIICRGLQGIGSPPRDIEEEILKQMKEVNYESIK